MAPAHRTVDSNKNDTKTERKCGLRGREPCYVILISWRKSVGTRHIFSPVIDHRLIIVCGRPYSKSNLIQIKCCAVEMLLVVVYIVSSRVKLVPQTSRSAAVAEVCGIVCVLN